MPSSDTVLLCEGIIACRLTIDQATGAILDTISETDRRWYDSDYMTRQLPFDSSVVVITNFYGTPNGLATESEPEDDASPSGCGSGYTSDEFVLESADVEPTSEVDSATPLRTATRLDSSLVLEGIVGVVGRSRGAISFDNHATAGVVDVCVPVESMVQVALWDNTHIGDLGTANWCLLGHYTR